MKKLIVLLLLLPLLAHSQTFKYEKMTIKGLEHFDLIELNFFKNSINFHAYNTFEGHIYISYDSFKTYQKMPFVPGEECGILFCRDSLHYYSYLNSKPIYYTRDAGRNWTKIVPNLGIQGPMFFPTDNIGYYFDRRSIYKTIDTGRTWKHVFNSGSGTVFFDMYFVDSLFGSVVGYKDKVWLTKDGGKNWERMETWGEMFVDDVYFSDYDTGFVVSGSVDFDGILSKTFDGGKTWRIDSIPKYIGYEISHFKRNIIINAVINTDAYCCDTSSIFLLSRDNGKHWITDTLPWQMAVTDVQMINDSLAYAIGLNGLVVKISIPKQLTTAIKESKLPEKIQLHLNPNPVKDHLNIEFSLSQRAKIKLGIMDIMGKRTLIQTKFFDTGNHHLPYNTSNLSPGTYILLLETENQTLTQKFIKVKP